MDIEEIVKLLKGELHVGKRYAKLYVFLKKVKPQWAQWFQKMSTQEMEHAEYLKTMGQQFVDDNSVFTAEEKKNWNECMDEYAECTALVQMMLNS